MKNNIKQFLPHITAIILFLLISLMYFTPVIKGDKLNQHDKKTWKGGAKEVVDYKAETGEHSLWTNSLFGGMPSYLITRSRPNNLFVYLYKVLDFSHPVSIVFLYMLGFFIALLVFKVNPWLSIIGALAYAFSSYFFIIIEAGHLTKALALGFMPPIVAGVHWAFNGKKFAGATLMALFLTLQIIVNHLQITYYTFLIVLIYGIFVLINTIKEKTYKEFSQALGLLIVGAILALTVNFTSIATIYDYGKDSIRGKSELSTNKENKTSGLDKDYINAWSYGITETFTLLVPNLMGGASGGELSENSNIYKDLINAGVPDAKKIIKNMPLYWGAQPFTSGPVYIGALIFFLFILGLFLVKGDLRWWLLSATLLSIILAWGKNASFITDLFINYFPGYNKFRSVSMTLIIAEFTMPLLGILALKEIIDKKVTNDEIIKGLKYAVGITVGLILVLMIPGILSFENAGDARVFPENMISSLEADRASLFRMDALRSIFFIVVGAAAIFFYLKEKLKLNYLYLAIAFIILIDLWPVAKRYLNNDDFVRASVANKVFTPSKCDNYILQDKELDYRVLNLTVSPFNDASTSYFHKSIGGYHGAKMRRYQEFIDNTLNTEISKLINGLNSKLPMPSLDSLMGTLSGINMLNTKYIILNADGMPLLNKATLGNAWYIENIKTVNSADEEIIAIQNFDASKTAIVNTEFKNQVSNFSNDNNATIFYAKGWNAYIDDKKVEHFRANYILRGIKVPAGEHIIKFKFEPQIWILGNTISLIGSIVLILFILFNLFFIYKTEKSKKGLTQI